MDEGAPVVDGNKRIFVGELLQKDDALLGAPDIGTQIGHFCHQCIYRGAYPRCQFIRWDAGDRRGVLDRRRTLRGGGRWRDVARPAGRRR